MLQWSRHPMLPNLRVKPLVASALSLLLAACAAGATLPQLQETGSTSKAGEVNSRVASAPVKRTVGDDLVNLKRRNMEAPGEAKIALAYSRALKSAGKLKDALAVVEKAAEAQANNRELTVAGALLQLELGQPKKAQQALAQVAATGPQDWRVLSGLGVAFSSQGLQGEAQQQFNRALELSPNNPSVLNNLAISYMLDRKTEQAEATLKQASAGKTPAPEIAQNLLLASGLKAKPTPTDKPRVTALAEKPEASKPAVVTEGWQAQAKVQ